MAYYQHILDDKIRPKLKDYFDYKPDIELRYSRIRQIVYAFSIAFIL